MKQHQHFGGLTEGITVKDAAGAYGTIANDGEHVEPTFVLKVLSADGEEVLKKERKNKDKSNE